ncbi:hypothetical protein MXB_411 [Myxobolus squamalis]|nr:hypothetical protein MXB_411 [Myxobolus squamalis]
MAEYLNMMKNGLAGFETQEPDPERFLKVSKVVKCYFMLYCHLRRKEKGYKANNTGPILKYAVFT